MPFVESKLKNLIGIGGNLYALLKSVNLSNVYFAGMGAEQARAYIIFVERNRKLLPFVYFYLITNEGKMFSYSPESIEIKNFEAVKEEALQMVESMGFIMEEIDLLSLSPQEAKEIVKTLPFYYENLEDFKKFMDEMEKGYKVDVGEVEIIEEGGEEEKEIEVEVEEKEISEEKEVSEESEEDRDTIRLIINKYGLGRLPKVERKSKISGSLKYVFGKLLASS
jgi:hypothetical protein